VDFFIYCPDGIAQFETNSVMMCNSTLTLLYTALMALLSLRQIV
jgi:hypothetical protein